MPIGGRDGIPRVLRVDSAGFENLRQTYMRKEAEFGPDRAPIETLRSLGIHIRPGTASVHVIVENDRSKRPLFPMLESH